MNKTANGCRPDQLFGYWSVEAQIFARMVDTARTIDLSARVPGPSSGDDSGPAYRLEGKTAVIEINGPMTKYSTSFSSFFGGNSTIQTRKLIRDANQDYRVNAIMLLIDSPGGTVAGTNELADEVAASEKPVYAYCDDMCASAAYWVASQCDKIFSNQTAMIGSIGTMAKLIDQSGKYEQAGVKVEVVSTGPFKGMGADGTPITDAQREETQRLVNEVNAPFQSAVQAGRDMTTEQLAAVSDGRVHVAETAKRMGLVDQIMPLESAFSYISQESKKMNLKEFQTFAAENPDATKDFIAQGHKAGRAEGRAESLKDLREIIAVCPNQLQQAVDYHLAGVAVDTAKLAMETAGKLTAVSDAKIKALEEENTKLKATSKTGDGAKVIPGTAAGASAAAGGTDAVATFEAKVKALTDGGMPRMKAVNQVATADSALYTEYLAAKNGKK